MTLSSHVALKLCVRGAVSALTVCLAASSGWFVFEAPWLSPPAPTLVNSVEGAEELLEEKEGVATLSVPSFPVLRFYQDFLYSFSVLVKESLFVAASCFSALLAALVLVLPSRVWPTHHHHHLIFQVQFLVWSLRARCVQRQMPWSMTLRSSSTWVDAAVVPQRPVPAVGLNSWDEG